MADKYSLIDLIKENVFLNISIFLVFTCLITGMFWHVSYLISRVSSLSALNNARLYIDALSEFRTVYSSDIVEVVSKHGIEASHKVNSQKGTIPLPATLTMLLGERIGKNVNGAKTKLYSPYPFPWRKSEGGLTDDFAKKAWARFSKNSEDPFYRFETIDGKEVLRYAVADIMRKSCVSCHNSYEGTPKEDWKVGDVRGVLEIMLPMDIITMKAKRNVKAIISGFTFIALLVMLFLVLLIRKHILYNRSLEYEVANRTMALQNEVHQCELYESELVIAKDAAERGSKAKSEFLNNINHEVRTPMTLILGFTDLLELETLSTSQKEHISEIRNSSLQLLDMINSMLDYSEIEEGNIQVALEEVTISQVINDCLNIVKPIARKFNVNVDHESIRRCQCKVMADYTRIKQVFLNLIINAIEYNLNEGSVAFDCREVEGNKVRFEVIDTGPGIEDEDKKLLFHPFMRIDATTTDIRGTGLGLVISKRLIEMMGGTIGFESKVGKGSTFWIELNRTE